MRPDAVQKLSGMPSSKLNVRVGLARCATSVPVARFSHLGIFFVADGTAERRGSTARFCTTSWPSWIVCRALAPPPREAVQHAAGSLANFHSIYLTWVYPFRSVLLCQEVPACASSWGWGCHELFHDRESGAPGSSRSCAAPRFRSGSETRSRRRRRSGTWFDYSV